MTCGVNGEKLSTTMRHIFQFVYSGSIKYEASECNSQRRLTQVEITRHKNRIWENKRNGLAKRCSASYKIILNINPICKCRQRWSPFALCTHGVRRFDYLSNIDPNTLVWENQKTLIIGSNKSPHNVIGASVEMCCQVWTLASWSVNEGFVVGLSKIRKLFCEA